MSNRLPAPDAASFAPTRWTVVLRAGGESAQAQQALAELCESYWMPVFRFLRGEGRDEETARELTQEFFARLLARRSLEGVQPERGRFRSYLLGAVKHFLSDVRDRDRRLKRGGGAAPSPLEPPGDSGTSPALRVPDAGVLPPDSAFDRAWAMAVMERALLALQRELSDAGKAGYFETLKPWLGGESSGLSQAEAAARMEMNEGAVKVAIHRLRKRFRELVRLELAQTVGTLAEVDEELRHLVDVLARA